MIEEDLLNALLPGASSLSAMLITVLAFLLTEYQRVKISEDLSKPYKQLALFISFAVIASAISALTSYLCLVFDFLSDPSLHLIYYVATGSFLLALLILIPGVLMVLRKVLAS